MGQIRVDFSLLDEDFSPDYDRNSQLPSIFITRPCDRAFP
jgi:hypothetical protein